MPAASLLILSPVVFLPRWQQMTCCFLCLLLMRVRVQQRYPSALPASHLPLIAYTFPPVSRRGSAVPISGRYLSVSSGLAVLGRFTFAN